MLWKFRLEAYFTSLREAAILAESFRLEACFTPLREAAILAESFRLEAYFTPLREAAIANCSGWKPTSHRYVKRPSWLNLQAGSLLHIAT